MANNVELSGKLVKEPYIAAKGWVGATLAVDKVGTDFKIWVNLFVPAGPVAKAFGNFAKDQEVMILGSIEDAKDKDGNRGLQVRVARIVPVKKEKSWDEGTEISDDDLPF